MGRELGPEDEDVASLVESGHLEHRPSNTPWRDFLKYIEQSRCVLQATTVEVALQICWKA